VWFYVYYHVNSSSAGKLISNLVFEKVTRVCGIFFCCYRALLFAKLITSRSIYELVPRSVHV
jgi:hypothetical protein